MGYPINFRRSFREAFMNVNILRNKKIILEEEIYLATTKLVNKFKEDTGFSPRGIEIKMVDVTKIGDKESQFMVSRCNIVLEI